MTSRERDQGRQYKSGAQKRKMKQLRDAATADSRPIQTFFLHTVQSDISVPTDSEVLSIPIRPTLTEMPQAAQEATSSIETMEIDTAGVMIL